jgi:ABC-2 type transport system ATP-binding protein
MKAIEVKDLTKKYGDLIAVDGISFSVEQGEIFGLLGPNGAGKTTTLMILSTLLQLTGGTAFVNGYNVVENPLKVRESIGMVFQDPSSDNVLTAYENLFLHALLYNVPMKEIDSRIEKVMKLVELDHRKHDILKKYSGGMRRRMEIARGLLHEPDIFFLDEPTIGLDPQSREHIWQYIKSLAERRKMTIILTTHYMEEAEKLCDRVAIIDHGKIIALDTPQNLIMNLGGDIVILRGKDVFLDETKISFPVKIQKYDGYLKVTLKNLNRNLQELMNMAKGVESVEIHSANLNDVFLHYTGRDIRDGWED